MARNTEYIETIETIETIHVKRIRAIYQSVCSTTMQNTHLTVRVVGMTLVFKRLIQIHAKPHL